MDEAVYRCPGQKYTISRAVHLGRLAHGFAPCRECRHRDDTLPLAPRLVAKLQKTWARPPQEASFDGEALAGLCPQALPPATVRRLGVALGLSVQPAAATAEAPVVAVGGDGRLLAAELVAAAAEGLRWAGCHVVDLGSSHAAEMALAIDHLQLAGGILVGNPSDGSHTAGLKFWLGGPRPLSASPDWDRLAALAAGPVDRPTRRAGSSRRFDARGPYRQTLAEFYHALRPLRWVLSSACQGARECLDTMAAAVACTVLPAVGAGEMPEKIRAAAAHFGVEIAADGEVCRLWDERGQPVPFARLLMLLARHALRDRPDGVIVLSPDAPPRLVQSIEQLGGRPVRAERSTRSALDETFRRHQAILGGGPGERIWHAVGYPSADALRSLSQLLVLLSRSDRRLSEVLDAEAALD
jgi:phosphomannomutase/phosphoglucomutase